MSFEEAANNRLFTNTVQYTEISYQYVYDGKGERERTFADFEINDWFPFVRG